MPSSGISIVDRNKEGREVTACKVTKDEMEKEISLRFPLIVILQSCDIIKHAENAQSGLSWSRDGGYQLLFCEIYITIFS